ncbi:MAG: multicopper oxidase family protein [Casimicrobiaceae bacterium]
MQTLVGAAGVGLVPVGWRSALAATPSDVVIRLTAARGRVPIAPGPSTDVLRFTAEVIAGRADAVVPSTGYLGPTLELRRGERVRIEFINHIDEPSIVHWHGMIVPDRADGHPRFAVATGRSYGYDFTVRNPAGTYLYHPHPHGRTGGQVYRGLAGLLIVRDDEEAAAGLPPPEREVALVIQDRRFDRGNQFVYKRTMMDSMNGVLGDTVLVNGMRDAAFKVAPQTYRLRLANVSNARIYKLAWSDGRPMRVVAAGNGMFSRAEGVRSHPYVVLAPFQRIEVLADFGERAGAREVMLMSETFDDPGGMGGMMRGMMGRGMMGGMMGGGAQGEQLHVARFVINAGPAVASASLRLPDLPASGRAASPVHTRLAFQMMQGTLNGRVFQMDAVAGDERLPLDEETIWSFSNEMGGMSMPHPMHVHGVRFRVIERSAGAPDDLRNGLVDAGYQDTVLVFPGERVRLGVTPTEAGLFMYHCHNLEHEDGGMMRNCWFGPGALRT